MCDRHYINKWLVHYPRCEAVNLPRILFVTEGHFNNFLLCSDIRNLHAWPYSLLAMAMSCVLHMFLALVFILVCEMFLWKGRTYGYCVSNALSGRGREILHPDSNPEVHSSMSCLVFFFSLTDTLLVMCHRRRSLAWPVIEDAFICVSVHAKLDCLAVLWLSSKSFCI